MTMRGEGRKEPPLHGDTLDEVISRVPTLHLVSASHVSTLWRRAVASSFVRRCRPWLVLHLHNRRDPSTPLFTHAYDAHSHVWVKIPRQQLSHHKCALASSHPGLLHSLSPSSFVVSMDAFALAWRRVPPPRVWREDAVVALVGPRLVVAGGAHGLEFDPSAVEVHSLDGGWEACEPLPEPLGGGSGAATRFSVAATDSELYLLHTRAGRLSCFDPESKRWGRTRQLSAGSAVFLSAIGVSDGRLVLVEAYGSGATEVETVRVWVVDGESMERKEMGQMPENMVKRMVEGRWGLSSSIGLLVVGGFGYVYNPSDLREIFQFELGVGNLGCRWTSIGIPTVLDRIPLHKAVFGCSKVGMDDLLAILRRPAAA